MNDDTIIINFHLFHPASNYGVGFLGAAMDSTVFLIRFDVDEENGVVFCYFDKTDPYPDEVVSVIGEFQEQLQCDDYSVFLDALENLVQLEPCAFKAEFLENTELNRVELIRLISADENAPCIIRFYQINESLVLGDASSMNNGDLAYFLCNEDDPRLGVDGIYLRFDEAYDKQIASLFAEILQCELSELLKVLNDYVNKLSVAFELSVDGVDGNQPVAEKSVLQ